DMTSSGIPVSMNYRLYEVTYQCMPDRRAHAYLAIPNTKEKRGAVLAIGGHGTSGESVMHTQGYCNYGRHLAEMGYVVLSPDTGDHNVQHQAWTVMGQSAWTAIVSIDYLLSRPEVDAKKGVAVCGLSMGGELTMYVAALDERVIIADAAGFLCRTELMRMHEGHCPCWLFPGLEENFDFPDVFALAAPRRLILEIGEGPEPDFPTGLAETTYIEVRKAYEVFDAEDKVTFVPHRGGHTMDGHLFYRLLNEMLGTPFQRGEIRRAPTM
ncbi:MAG: hypothetical protein A2Z18_03930, partial [Armatimonadetes bacterium RBG_16_58_9]